MRNEFDQNGREENSSGISSETLMVPIIVNRIDNGGIFIQLYVRFTCMYIYIYTTPTGATAERRTVVTHGSDTICMAWKRLLPPPRRLPTCWRLFCRVGDTRYTHYRDTCAQNLQLPPTDPDARCATCHTAYVTKAFRINRIRHPHPLRPFILSLSCWLNGNLCPTLRSVLRIVPQIVATRCIRGKSSWERFFFQRTGFSRERI